MPPRKKAAAPTKPKAQPKPKVKPAAKAKATSKAKAPPKKPAVTKSKSKLPVRSLSPDLPEMSTKRRKLSSAETPEWDKNITTQSQRDKARFKMSRASLYDESINERSIDLLYESLDPKSLSKATWGIPMDSPLKATTGPKAKSSFSRSTKRMMGGLKQKYMAMMEDMKRPRRQIVPNSPERSSFLRLSLEIREIIYACSLRCSGPILVRRDWKTVETSPMINHAIRRVCKQLHFEATSFLFKTNTIQAIFRKTTRAAAFYDAPAMIAPRFVSYYRNVVLDFNSDCWSYDWYEKATESLKVLIAAKPVLNSLTIMVSPKRVGMSTTALGTEGNPVTFADLVWYDGEFMKALKELSPRTFKIVIKKGATKKLTVSVDLKYLNASSPQEPQLVNSVTWNMLLRKEERLNCELKGLKDTFEEIYEDDEWAVKQGKCTTNEWEVEVPPPTLAIEEGAKKAVVEERFFEDDPEVVCTNFGGDSEDSEDSESEDPESGRLIESKNLENDDDEAN